jgi:hypothetical protein
MAEGETALLAPGHQPAGDGHFLAVEISKLGNERPDIMCATALGWEWVQPHVPERLRFSDPNIPYLC